MVDGFLNNLIALDSFKDKDIDLLAPLSLAYIGDAVYELYVRTYLIKRYNVSVHKLHVKSIRFVKAKAQSDIVHLIEESLSQEEADVVRRGRNAKSGTIPKNADVGEYKYATGFEALIGYLYLKKRYDRLNEIFSICIDKIDTDKLE